MRSTRATTSGSRSTHGHWSTSSTSTTASSRLCDHDYTSHNTDRLDVDQVKDVLNGLPEIRQQIAARA